jgi:hypothetical protein
MICKVGMIRNEPFAVPGIAFVQYLEEFPASFKPVRRDPSNAPRITKQNYDSLLLYHRYHYFCLNDAFATRIRSRR